MTTETTDELLAAADKAFFDAWAAQEAGLDAAAQESLVRSRTMMDSFVGEVLERIKTPGLLGVADGHGNDSGNGGSGPATPTTIPATG